MRMDKRIPKHKRMERVDHLLDQLGLRSSENTLIGFKEEPRESLEEK